MQIKSHPFFACIDWAALDRRSPDMRAMVRGLWRMLAAPGPAQCAPLKKAFMDNYVWRDKAPYATPLTGRWSDDYLAFVASTAGLEE